MSKILVLQGPPASGKSTFARKFISENKHWVIVCRDSIRDSLGDYWVPERENLVSKIERDNIISAIQMGWNVIIDATNSNPKTIAKWEAVADEYKCEIEYKDFWIPFHEAVANDNNDDRQHKVGYKVIKSFYERYKPELLNNKDWDYRYMKPRELSKKKAIICDIDGTFAIHQGRNAFDYEKCDSDKPEMRLSQILFDLYMQDYTIIFLSGREKIGNCEQKTEAWIIENFGGCFQLYMREEKDHRPDQIIKEEMYHKYIEPYYDVVAVFDDRNKVIDMWRNELGLFTCQTYYGDF